MKAREITSSLFWLLVSIAVLIGSLRMGIGSVDSPGRGFLPFGASGLLGILSLILFLQAAFRKKETLSEPFVIGKLRTILFVLIALAAYAVFMPAAGYLISTFILMTSLFWILEKKNIGWVLLFSLLSTLLTYLVFSKWLNCQFPEGFFGF